MTTWAEAAIVVRSNCHETTWIGHVRGATYEDTPAGPLRVVKRECELMVREDEEDPFLFLKWKREGDSWLLFREDK